MQPRLRKPSNLTATAASSSQINLSWKDNSNDEQGFKIERKTGAGGAYSQVATVPANTTAYSNAGLSPSTTYYYRVRAYSGTENGSYSNEASATTRGTPPPAPTGLAASPSNASVTLSWAASAGATSYNVKRSTASGGPYATVATGVTATSYTNTGLANGTTYYYVVSAVNANGEGANSAEASATPLAPPAAPTGLTATASGTQISLAWTASTNATSYNVKRATVAGGPYASVVTGLTTTGYTDGGLASGTTYYYVVSAVGSSGEGANSAEASAMTAPAAPTGLTAAAGDTQVRLSWNASAGASSYKVFRATSPSGYSAPLVSSITTTSYTDSTAVNGTTYYYVVRAANAAGDSASSNEVSATPINNPPTVSITNPTNNASFTAPATITIDATASDGDGTVGKVEFFQGSDKLGEDTSAPYSYPWSNAAVGNYTLTAKATDNGGATTTSSAVNITVLPAPPSAPTGLTATAASSSQINLNWADNSSDETGFKIERKQGAGGSYAEVMTVGANVTTYNDTGLSAATQYYYRVRAHNAGVNSGYSNEANATTNDTAPAAPSGLTAAAASSSQVNLSWIDNSTNETGFKIERKTGAGAYAQVDTVGAGVTTYSDMGLTAATQYYYRVRAYNVVGDSAYSDEANATTNGTPPAAPTGLTATASNTQVTLAWTASTNATSYNVKRATAAGGPYASVVTGVTTTGYTNTGLANGTTYYYVVSAVNANGEGANSAEASAMTAPAAPTGLTTTPGNAQVSLAWSASTGATGYNVKRATTSGGTYTTIVTGVTATSYTDTGVTNGTTYYYVVAAVNASGESPNSAQASATPGVTPPAPTNLTATAGNAQISLSWTASSGATSYNLYRGPSSGFIPSDSNRAATGLTATSYTNTGLTNGTAYYFIVRAVNAAGESGNSNEASATPSAGVEVGQWSAPIPWLVSGIHMHVLPTGKVMFHTNTGRDPDSDPRLWDPATGAFTAAAKPGYNIYCSGHSFLPDGRLFFISGHIASGVGPSDASIYNPFTDSWTRTANMNAGRWYPTSTTLPNGDVLAISGRDEAGLWNNVPQVWQKATGTWRNLSDAQLQLFYYPFMFVAPNGKVFNAGSTQITRYLDTSGTGSWTTVASTNYGRSRDRADLGRAPLYPERGDHHITADNARRFRHRDGSRVAGIRRRCAAEINHTRLASRSDTDFTAITGIAIVIARTHAVIIGVSARDGVVLIGRHVSADASYFRIGAACPCFPLNPK
jgi:titin